MNYYFYMYKYLSILICYAMPVIIILLFFSISKGKRPQYILPIYPALALLVGYLGYRAILFWEEKFYKRAVIIPSVVLLGILVLLALASPIGVGIYFKPDCWSKPEFWVAIGMSVITIIFIILISSAWKRQKVQQLLLLPAIYVLTFTIYGVHFIVPKMEDYKSPRPFCEEIKVRLEQGVDWAMYNFYRAAYVYYTDSLVDVIMTKEELGTFLDRPAKSIVAMRERDFDGLEAVLKNKMFIVYRRQIGHRPMVLVSNQKE